MHQERETAAVKPSADQEMALENNWEVQNEIERQAEQQAEAREAERHAAETEVELKAYGNSDSSPTSHHGSSGGANGSGHGHVRGNRTTGVSRRAVGALPWRKVANGRYQYGDAVVV